MNRYDGRCEHCGERDLHISDECPGLRFDRLVDRLKTPRNVVFTLLSDEALERLLKDVMAEEVA